jgi:hypothetical protein
MFSINADSFSLNVIPKRGCTQKAIQDFARRIGSLKAKPIARLERTPTAPLNSFRSRKRHDPATGPEDL